MADVVGYVFKMHGATRKVVVAGRLAVAGIGRQGDDDRRRSRFTFQQSYFVARYLCTSKAATLSWLNRGFFHYLAERYCLCHDNCTCLINQHHSTSAIQQLA